jgi:hypothetical protein
LNRIIPFPRERLHRFIGIEKVAEHHYRARIFLGCRPDPMFCPGSFCRTPGDALHRARSISMGNGLPLRKDALLVPPCMDGAA